MKHLGDITKINGHNVPLVDIVTGGSPCQDLSVAGKRAGLEGARSGLFMEQIRIIKEMRDEARQLCMRGAIEHIRPRYMVWENVPGAFSSNKGEDFRAVLEETAKVCDKDAIIPRPESGKWSPSGVIMGNGWSIAWRVHDAQFWGVPQRRKRIALVADFGGDTAPEILFESKGVYGDIRAFKAKRERTSEIIGECANKTDKAISVVCYNGESLTSPQNKQNPQYDDPCHTLGTDSRNYVVIENHGADSRWKFCNNNIFQTLSSAMGTGGNNVPLVMDKTKTIVRKLTPLECERLQGYPDHWTDIGEWTDSKGKKHKDADSPRYKALGNSIALPFWEWMAKRMVSHLDTDHPTMASLFDGIGGFPLVYSRAGCNPIWASEIEEFPIAVTKIRFPE